MGPRGREVWGGKSKVQAAVGAAPRRWDCGDRGGRRVRRRSGAPDWRRGYSRTASCLGSSVLRTRCTPPSLPCSAQTRRWVSWMSLSSSWNRLHACRATSDSCLSTRASAALLTAHRSNMSSTAAAAAEDASPAADAASGIPAALSSHAAGASPCGCCAWSVDAGNGGGGPGGAGGTRGGSSGPGATASSCRLGGCRGGGCSALPPPFASSAGPSGGRRCRHSHCGSTIRLAKGIPRSRAATFWSPQSAPCELGTGRAHLGGEGAGVGQRRAGAVQICRGLLRSPGLLLFPALPLANQSTRSFSGCTVPWGG